MISEGLSGLQKNQIFLILKTVEKFGGKKGDLSRAVEDAVKTWISKKE